MSSPDSATRPKQKPTTSSSPASTTSQPRRRGGPGGPVPVTTTNPRASSQLHLDMSGLRIDNDTESVRSSETTNTTGTSSSRRRRRRRNNKNALQKVEGAAGFGTIPPIPSSSKSGGKGGKKPAKLQIGLNLDLELELKAKIGGDLTLSMVLEEKPKPRDCPELPFPKEGEYVATELFYMRVGTLRMRRRWIDPDAVLRGQMFLTGFAALVLLAGGFVLGWLASGLAAGNGLPVVSFGRAHGGVMVSGSSESPSSWPDGSALAGRGGGCDCDFGHVDGAGLAFGSLSVGNSSSPPLY